MAVDEKLRPLNNKVRIAGTLISLSDLNEGTTKDGVPYCSFSGKLACDAEGKIEINFRTFEKAKTKAGKDMENYPRVLAWYKNAVPKSVDPENPTMVEIAGSLTDNPYVNAQGELVEACQYCMKYFSDFKEHKPQIDVEGYIESLVDEVVGEDSTPTGRMRMALVSRDGFGNTIVLKNIVIPEDFVDSLEGAGWEKGATIGAAIDIIPFESVKTVSTAAFGKQHAVQGFVRLERVITGGDVAMDPDSERALQRNQVKAMLVERKSKLDAIVENGYLGNKSESTVTRGSIGGSKPKAKVDTEFKIDEEFPF